MEKENSESEDSENFSFHPKGYGWRRSVGRHSQEYKDFITCFLTEVAKRKGINPDELVALFFLPISSQSSQQNETTPSESQEQAASEEKVNSGIVRVYRYKPPEFIPPSPFDTKQRYGRYSQPQALQLYPPIEKVNITGFQAKDLQEEAAFHATYMCITEDDGRRDEYWSVRNKERNERFKVPLKPDLSLWYEALADALTAREQTTLQKGKDIPIFVG